MSFTPRPGPARHSVCRTHSPSVRKRAAKASFDDNVWASSSVLPASHASGARTVLRGDMTSIPQPEELTCTSTEDDAIFYAHPKLVQHLDDGFKARLKALYEEELPRGGDILDLCASWDSHLPDMPFRRVVGHGMNRPELKANPRLTEHFVQDLNRNPMLTQLKTASFDAVLCCDGFQYLRRPFEVWKEVERILQPGGIVIVSFSPHCFQHKAFVGWLRRNMEERALLVSKCLELAGMVVQSQTLWDPFHESPVIKDSIDDETIQQCRQNHHQPLRHADPFCAVIAARRANNHQNEVDGWPRANAQMAWSPGSEGSNVLSKSKLAAKVGFDDPELDKPEDASAVQRSREAYGRMVRDAVGLGIPFSVIPAVSPDSGSREIEAAQEHLANMMASFSSARI